jgi:spore maturation protein CgeB
MKITFFGSNLISAYWNGIMRALAERGHQVEQVEPGMIDHSAGSDLVISVGAQDAVLADAVLSLQRPNRLVVFWDVDPAATIERLRRDPHDPFAALIPHYDLIFTCGGGPSIVGAYEALGARRCVPIHKALEPATHHRVSPDPRFSGTLGFLGHRTRHDEHRVEDLFFTAARHMPDRHFLLAGADWHDRTRPRNVAYLGHVFARDHNAFNATPLAILDIGRDSPATRMFEAAGAGACLITDAWAGVERFLEPDREVLVANDGAEVVAHLQTLTQDRARSIGQRAMARMLREHTYAHRAVDVETALGISKAPPRDRRLSIVILGLSITSSWGNGHATTYRGLSRELAARGHSVLFLERDAPWYAAHRDLANPQYARTELYSSLDEVRKRFSAQVRDADLVIVGSYVPDGTEVGRWVIETARGATAFYDIDTPVTLARLAAGNCEYLAPDLVPRYGMYLSFTGGPILARIERELGAARALPLYCSVDPALYGPERRTLRWDLGYMGTYGADRQNAVDELLLAPARQQPTFRFVLAGAQYPATVVWPSNVQRIDHVPPHAHCTFYNEMAFTLNVTRADMRAAGWSPSVRLFEAAACGIAIISDRWQGLEELFEPGSEILIAEDREDVLRYLRDITETERRAIGARACARVRAAHTAAHRAAQLERYART